MISSTLLIKSSVAVLSDTPSTVSNANRVLLQSTGTSTAASVEVVIKSDIDPADFKSILLLGGHELIIKKHRLHTIEVASGVTTVYATSVGVEG